MKNDLNIGYKDNTVNQYINSQYINSFIRNISFKYILQSIVLILITSLIFVVNYVKKYKGKLL